MAASGTISTGSMVVCCLHHVTDVLPLFGLSAAVVFLTKYQEAFLLGILSSLLGLAWMLRVAQEHGVEVRSAAMRGVLSIPWKQAFPLLLLFSLFLLAVKTFMSLRP